MQMYSESDVDISCLRDQKIAVLGYGSQGRAHALNLKDSGFNVVVGLRKDGASWPLAEADGLDVAEPNDAVKGAADRDVPDAGYGAESSVSIRGR